MISLLTTEQLKEVLKIEIHTYFQENPLKVLQEVNEPEAVDLDGLLKYRPIIGAKSTIYKKASMGGIPHSKRGKKLYFNLKEIDVWLLSKKVRTPTEIEQETTDFLTRKIDK